MKNRDTEIREAIQAADNTLEHLNRAQDCLKSADNWSLMDMLGGGMLSTFMKRGKMNDAQQELSEARAAMRHFASELRDVNEAVDIHIVLDDFLGFADYFFDGLITDWMVQSRINTARAQVSEAIDKVRTARSRLQGML